MRIFRQRSQEKQKSRSRQYVSSGSHSAKIFIGCLLVIIPMVVFTIVMLALVFSNNLEDVTCPYAEICPQQPLVNVTSKSHYYVDYPAARLVWISSFSSTVSFAMIGVIMTMFAYHTASQLLSASSQLDGSDSLLGPYQTSLLLRVLNTDYLSLWDSFMYRRSRSSMRATSTSPPSAKQTILRRATIVFCIGIFASIAIQAADGYLHIATKAVEMVSIISKPLDTYQYSKRIGSWCFDQSTAGTPANINFWGCGIRFDIPTDRVYMANRTKFFEVIIDTLDEYVLNYTEPDGTQYAIVGPANSEPGADWKASSFAVSTKCSAIPMSACKINHTAPARGFINSWNCSKALGSPVDLKGRMTTVAMTMNSIDFHKYLAEEAPFEGQISVARFDNDTVSNTSIAEANEVWKNPWQWVGQTYLPVDTKELLENTKNTSWQLRGDYEGERALISHCTSTVYDVAYTAVGGKVTSLTKRLSNSTTAGIAIGPTIKSFAFINARTYITAQRANITPNLKSWEAAYAYGMSKLYMAPLAIHTVPTPDQLAQTRVTKIVTQLPAAALWLLVTANMGYAILAAVIAIIAWKASNGAVEQVQVRLGMGGLAAALFDDGSENRIASGESKLFHENESGNRPLVKVSIQPTDVGGMLWMRQAARPDDWQASEYSSSYQGFGYDNISDTSKLTSHEMKTGAQIRSDQMFPKQNSDRSALLREDERAPAEADLIHAPTQALYSTPGSRNQWY